MSPEKPDTDTLTPRQKRFVDLYITLENPTKACIEAGYSPKSARTTGYEILKNPTIKRAIEARLLEVNAGKGLTPDDIRRKIRDLADNATKEDTRLRALELLGRATPGTFEPARAPVEINLFAILGKLIDTPMPVSAIDTTTTPVIASIEPASPVTPTDTARPADPTSPPATPLYVDIQPDKIVDQISSSTTPVAEQDTKQ